MSFPVMAAGGLAGFGEFLDANALWHVTWGFSLGCPQIHLGLSSNTAWVVHRYKPSKALLHQRLSLQLAAQIIRKPLNLKSLE